MCVLCQEFQDSVLSAASAAQFAQAVTQRRRASLIWMAYLGMSHGAGAVLSAGLSYAYIALGSLEN